MMRTPSLISDERLRREVEDCISEDRDNSPHLDRVKRGMGAEYEFILQQKLRARYVYIHRDYSSTLLCRCGLDYRACCCCRHEVFDNAC